MEEPVWGSMLATYRSYGCVGASLGQYVGNLHVLWGGLGQYVGNLQAVCWQPTGLMGCVGMGLGLYVGNLQVLWGVLERDWGSMLATYRTRGACLGHFGGVCWQPTGLN